MEFRELSPTVRLGIDEWFARSAEANPAVVLRRSGEPRPEGEAFAIPLQDTRTGARYEVVAWPDGSVTGLRELA